LGAGFIPAWSALATLHLEGRGVAQDEAAAVECWRTAADRGFASAQHNMALAIEQGIGGLTPDSQQAIEWWERAAEQGFEPSKEALEHLAASGMYTPKGE